MSVQSRIMSYWRMMARAEALSSRSGCGTASTPELRVATVVARLAALLTPSLASECATWRCRLLYCTVLYCTVLCATWRCRLLYCTVLYCTPPGGAGCCTVLYRTVLYCTVLYCTVLYRTVLYATWRCRLLVSTVSWSTRPSLPTPAPARYRAAGQPRPDNRYK